MLCLCNSLPSKNIIVAIREWIQEEAMREVKSIRSNPARSKKVVTATVRSLVADLGSEDGLVRVRARKSLVDIGKPAVKPLVDALASKRQWLRWEAAKALGQIGDAKATIALIKALEDKMFDVRWLAAEGLISIGHKALVPLLQAIMARPDSLWLQEGVHHVLHNLEGGHLNKTLDPILQALEGFEPSVETPPVVEKALDVLTKKMGSKYHVSNDKP
jgi:HEAT repeat protein